MTRQHVQERWAKISSLISFNFSQRIRSNGHALTIGCLISMRNLCMKLTVCTKMAALQTNLEYFIKRGDPQQCLLKLTEQDCCSSYKYLEVVPWRQLQFTSNRKVDRTVYELFPPGMMPCACCWSAVSREKATLRLFWMETFCSMEDELTWMGLWNGAVEGQLLLQERSIIRTWRSGQKTLDM